MTSMIPGRVVVLLRRMSFVWFLSQSGVATFPIQQQQVRRQQLHPGQLANIATTSTKTTVRIPTIVRDNKYCTTSSTTIFQSSASNNDNTKKATLTDETEWKIRFVLRNVSTEKNQKVNDIFIIQGQFLEDDGYEPPQGTFRQTIARSTSATTTTREINDDNTMNDDTNKNDGPIVRILSSRWQLSEDPNDRKDGLWIWGLFKEPLYPYMLLRLDTDSIPLSSGDSIKPLQLYAQINHKRDANLGVVLDGADLKIRQVETIQADPFGVAKVDIYEEVSVGTISIQRVVPTTAVPTTTPSKKQ